jgi:predicted transcriptional regulator
MAGGGMTITLDEALAERVRAAAKAAGLSVDEFARRALERALDAEDRRRESVGGTSPALETTPR